MSNDQTTATPPGGAANWVLRNAGNLVIWIQKRHKTGNALVEVTQLDWKRERFGAMQSYTGLRAH